ncbi:hypothetical protein MKW92_000300 [Papaver armeniacum]|nr:hypothetical protein MKW92_000300 [Papaver armeniacum]
MRRTLHKIGGSSSSLYSCRQHFPPVDPVPRSNPSLVLPHSSSSSALFNRVFYLPTHVPISYFYCDTEDFKEMINDYKNGNKKMYSYIMEAQLARRSEHKEEDSKLIRELLDYEYRDIKDMDPEEMMNTYFRDSETGKWKEDVRTPTGNLVVEFPPNPYGISGSDFQLFGKKGGNIEYPLGKPKDYTRYL